MPADTYRDFVLDQLSPLESRLECRRMFGGYGLYLGSAFFGILHRGRLFFKTDDGNRPKYETRGMKSFRPNPSQTLRNYFEVPVDVVENRERLVRWARRAARAKS